MRAVLVLTMNTCLCLCLCLCLSVGASDVLDRTIRKVTEGDDAVVMCNVTQSPDVHIYWTKEHHQGIYEDGIKLQFTNISRQDSGNYTCHSVNVSNPVENVTVETVSMDVMYPAEITMFSVEPDKLMENTSLTIRCKVSGNPNPVWELRNNRTKEVLGQGNFSGYVTVGIGPMHCDQSGLYMCTGANQLNHGLNVTREHNVTVLCAPRPRSSTADHYKQYAVLGMDVLFFENEIGYPYPNYTWSRAGGQPMGSVEEYNAPWFSAINISDVKMTDFGQYFLTMSNIYGSHRSTFSLLQYGGPTTSSPYHHQGLTTKVVVIISVSASGGALTVVVAALVAYNIRRKKKANKSYKTRLLN